MMNRIIHLLPLDRREIEDESFHGRISALGNIYHQSEILNEETIKNMSENKSKFQFCSEDNSNLTNFTNYMSPYKERLGIKAQSELNFPFTNPEYYYQNRSSHYFFLFKKRLLSINKDKNKNKNNGNPSTDTNPLSHTISFKSNENKSDLENDFNKSQISSDHCYSQKNTKSRKFSSMIKTQTIKNDLSYSIIQNKITNDYANFHCHKASQQGSRASFHKTKFSTFNCNVRKSSALKELHDLKHKIAKDSNKKYLINISFLKRNDQTTKKGISLSPNRPRTREIKVNLFNKQNNRLKDNSKACINSLIDGCEKIRTNSSGEISGYLVNMSRKHEIFNKTCKIIRNIDAGDINTLKNLYNYQRKKEDEEISDLHKLYTVLKEELSNPLRIAAKLEKQKSSDIRKRKAKKKLCQNRLYLNK